MKTPDINTALARHAKEIARGDRDARRAIAARQVRAAARTASPAGLLALFPGLKKPGG